jgi:hypothetical protein
MFERWGKYLQCQSLDTYDTRISDITAGNDPKPFQFWADI